MPLHIGDPEHYPEGDPYAAFLPPLESGPEFRAVVIVRDGSRKGTERSHQEYPDPLLMLTGREYDEISFKELHERLTEALQAGRPRRTLVIVHPGGRTEVHYDDGSRRDLEPP